MAMQYRSSSVTAILGIAVVCPPGFLLLSFHAYKVTLKRLIAMPGRCVDLEAEDRRDLL